MNSNNTTLRALESRRRRDEIQLLKDNELYVTEASLATSELTNLLSQFTSKKVGTNDTTELLLSRKHENNNTTYNNNDDLNNDNEDYYDNDIDDMNDSTPDPIQWIRNDERRNNYNKLSLKTPYKLLAYTKNNTRQPLYSSLLSSSTTKATIEKTKGNNVTTPARKSTFQRADTPVMSNSSARKLMKNNQLLSSSRKTPNVSKILNMNVDNDEDIYDDDNDIPINVKSPWIERSATKNTPTPNKNAMMTPNALNSLKFIKQTSTTYVQQQQQQQQQQQTHINAIDFKRYYNSVCNFVRSKRNVVDHIISIDEQIIDNNNINNNSIVIHQSEYDQLTNKECQIDIDFLLQLKTISYNISISNENNNATTNTNNDYKTILLQESNFWYLLSTLRSLGLSYIIFDNDEQSNMQYQYSIQGYIQKLVLDYITYTPKDLLNAFYCNNDNNNKSNINNLPFLLQRRLYIIEWLEYCFNKKLSPNIMNINNTLLINDTTPKNVVNELNQQQYQPPTDKYKNHLIKQGFISTNNDNIILDKCLSLILAGRLHDAQKLVRENDSTAWRAALWDGGKPHGYNIIKDDDDSDDDDDDSDNKNIKKTQYKSTGNPKRALWRRMAWNLAESGNNPTSITNGFNDLEIAISAILSSNIRVALDNPYLNKTWEQSLYVVYKAMMDRIEDELFHYHNNYRRQLIKNNFNCNSFPGIEYEKFEVEQLQSTSDIASFSDANVIELVNSNPMQFIGKQIYKTNLIIDATTSILIGKSSINEFMNNNNNNYDKNLNDNNPIDIIYHRFLTHFAIYLDSLLINSKTNTFTMIDGVSEWKNELLIQYIQYLTSNDDLWYMMIVYVSLLPENIILDILPNILINYESEKERKIIIDDLREYLNIRKNDFDLIIIRKIVRLILLRDDNEDNDEDNIIMEDDGDLDTALTRLDTQKMNSILWLLFEDEHLGDALIASTMLIRQFLLEENGYKLREVHIFINDILPTDLLDKVIMIQTNANGNKMSDEVDIDPSSVLYNQQVEHAECDFIAFQKYILAMDALDRWIEVINITSPYVTKASDDEFDDRLPKNFINKENLNDNELSIASSLDRRNNIETKRKDTALVMVAAGNAESLLLDVLKFQGGWLLTDDESIIISTNNSNDDDNYSNRDEEMIRRRLELSRLRSVLLPKVVTLYENVCSKTANWMYMSINDALEQQLVLSSRTDSYVGNVDVIKVLDANMLNENNNIAITSPLSPLYWTRKINQLSHICACDTYGIKSAFENTDDYQNLVQALAENAVNDIIYRSSFTRMDAEIDLDL